MGSRCLSLSGEKGGDAGRLRRPVAIIAAVGELRNHLAFRTVGA